MEEPAEYKANKPMPRRRIIEPIQDIFRAGQLAGMALQINDVALEQFLEKAPANFQYAELCRLTISYVRSIKNQS